MSSERYTPEFYLRSQQASQEKTLMAVAIVRAQEREKERNYEMKWVQDPEDHTLSRWVKVRKKTEK